MNKYIKFLRDIEDKETNFLVNKGDILPLSGYGEEEGKGKFYTTVINGQKYCYYEVFKDGCFEIV